MDARAAAAISGVDFVRNREKTPSRPRGIALDPEAPVWGYVAMYAFLIGGIARLGALARQSLWIDEFLWTRLASKSVEEIVFAADGYPPLFGLVIRGLQEIGLGSDVWLRMPSALAGTVCIPVLFLVASQLTNRRVAAIAAFLLAANPLAIWYSIEVGAYALIVLVALLSTSCLLKLLQGTAISSALLYALLTWCGFGLHYYYVFVPVGHALVVVSRFAGKPLLRHRIVRFAAPATLGLILWVPLLGSDLLAQAGDDVARSVSLAALPYTGFTLLGGLSLGPPLRSLHETIRTGQDVGSVLMGHAGIVLVVGVAIAGLIVTTLMTKRDSGMTVCLALIATTVVGPWMASTLGVGFRPRYVIAALPFVLIASVNGLHSLSRMASTALLLVVMLLHISGIRGLHHPQHAREDNRSAARYIAQSDPTLPVMLVGEGALPFVRYATTTTSPHYVEEHDVRDQSSLLRLVSAELEESGALWLVEARPWTVDRHGFARILPEHFRLDDRVTFAGVTVSRYSRFPRNVAGGE
jgi:Dolichyl-phosphate-mannose-protein mannosyltransferase